MNFFLSRFLRTFSSLLSVLFIKISSSDQELGVFIYWYTIILFFAIFIKYNNRIFVLRFKKNIDKYFGSFFIIQSLFFAVIIFSSIFFVPIKYYLPLLMCSVIFLFEPWENYYLINNNYNKVNKLIISLSLISIILKSILFYFYGSNISYYYLYLCSFDFSCGFFIFLIFERKIKFYRISSIRKVKQVFFYILPFFINSLLIYLSAKADHFLIKSMISFEDLGVYSFSYRFYEGSFIFQMIFSSILISKYNKVLEYKSFFSEKAKYFLRSWIYFGIGLTVLLILFIMIIYEKNYFINYNMELLIFIILLPGVVVSFFGSIMTNISSVHGYAKELVIINLSVFIISICLNIMFLSTYGIRAAAFITLISQLAGSIFLWFIFKNTRNLIKDTLQIVTSFNKIDD